MGMRDRRLAVSSCHSVAQVQRRTPWQLHDGTQFGPGSVPNRRNSMTHIGFRSGAEQYRPKGVRHRFGRFGPSDGFREKPLRFFCLVNNELPLRGAHNPLVAGSSPAGPTNPIAFNALWRCDRGTIMVPRWVGQSPPVATPTPRG